MHPTKPTSEVVKHLTFFETIDFSLVKLNFVAKTRHNLKRCIVAKQICQKYLKARMELKSRKTLLTYVKVGRSLTKVVY